MANTLASHINANFIIEGTPIYLYGKLASTYGVGVFVYESTAGVFTTIDADTAATILFKYGVVGYKERILSTGAASTIDTLYATTDTGVPILVGFREGEGVFVCKIEDPGAGVLRNGLFTASDTTGVIETHTNVTAGLAAGDPITGITNVNALVSGDVYMKARWLKV